MVPSLLYGHGYSKSTVIVFICIYGGYIASAADPSPPAIVAGDYAEKADYFAKSNATREQIATLKAKDRSEWPRQSGRIAGSVEITHGKGWSYSAQFPLEFRAENAQGAWQSGLLTCTMQFSFERGQPRIRQESNKRVRFERGGPQVIAPAVAQAQPVAGKARVFKGKGQVYKVPELAGLIGKPLKDAWLYGDFILRSVEGNMGHFNTMTRLILVKEGSTRLDIEFESGIELSAQAVAAMRDPMLVLPIQIPAERPMELLRVYRDGDGVVHVTARHALPLRK